MSEQEILDGVLKTIKLLDLQARAITPQMLIYSELDFDSLQMMNLVESIQREFDVNLLATDNLLRDFRTPAAMAAAIWRGRQGNGHCDEPGQKFSTKR